MFSRPRLSNHNRKGNDDSSPQHVDVLSSKLNELSIEERSNALHDLHGVADQISENPELINAKLDEMTRHLQASSARAKVGSAYKRALELSPPYVEGLKIRFLRAMRYDSQDAAARMMRFFERKLELFGEESLVRDLISSKDLTMEEQQAIQNGLVQLLPQRDRAGRATVFASGKMSESYPNTKTVMRCIFYFLMATSQDKESQLNGTVAIYYGVGQEKVFRGRPTEYLKTWDAIPFRVVAIHYCKDSSVLDGTVQFIYKAFESQLLCRMRFHIGTHMECIYNLMTFGIPREAIPVHDDESLNLDNHQQILQSLRYREEQALAAALCRPDVQPSSAVAVASLDTQHQHDDTTTITSSTTPTKATILVPGPKDVLMGRGRHPKTCTGALRLQNLLLEHRDEYEATPRAYKTQIAEIVLEAMKKSGCRFLTFTSGGFMVCDDSAAREKISHGFRNLRMKTKKSGSSSTPSSAGGGGGSCGAINSPSARKRNLVDSGVQLDPPHWHLNSTMKD